MSLEGIDLVELLGENNAKLQVVRQYFPDLTISARGDRLRIEGTKKDVQRATVFLQTMISTIREFGQLPIQMVQDIVTGENPMLNKLSSNNSNNIILHGRNGKPIKAKTRNQKKMVNLSETNDILFAVGPAGTGKTYTGVALAVRALKNRLVSKIILTRPAVEAGENLGFLPGDLNDKIDPYLRPLYDALNDMIPATHLAKMLETREIEIAPLAYMRGRTLDNAFVILDESQNASGHQLKMFLTRLGPSAKCIITGDLTQVDLPHHQKSGLKNAIALLTPIESIGLIELTTEDVLRHRLVKEIIRAYDRHDKEEALKKEARKAQKIQRSTDPNPTI